MDALSNWSDCAGIFGNPLCHFMVPNNSPLPPQIPLRVDEEKETEPENDIDRNFFSNFNFDN